MTTTCKQIMTPDPDCCLPDTSVRDVAEIMKRKDIGPVPVIQDADSHKLVGIITDRDVVLNVVAEGRSLSATRAGDIMTPNPFACLPTDDIEKALELMETHQVRRLPIVDENQKLLGIIAQADIAIRYHKHAKISELVEEVSKPAVVNKEFGIGH